MEVFGYVLARLQSTDVLFTLCIHQSSHRLAPSLWLFPAQNPSRRLPGCTRNIPRRPPKLLQFGSIFYEKRYLLEQKVVSLKKKKNKIKKNGETELLCITTCSFNPQHNSDCSYHFINADGIAVIYPHYGSTHYVFLRKKKTSLKLIELQVSIALIYVIFFLNFLPLKALCE